MNVREQISIACIAISKGWDFETMKYSDDLYGKENKADEIWQFVDECKAIGTVAFCEKYKVYDPKIYA